MSNPTNKLQGARRISQNPSFHQEEERLLLRVVEAQECGDLRIRQLISAGLDPLEAIRIVQTDQAA